ncbi:MAG TPA: peptide chain release factor 2 [Vicinamibacterales bacterium]|nr:peptide chain release factor 2 [Vicinamibacterales bacterium]
MIRRHDDLTERSAELRRYLEAGKPRDEASRLEALIAQPDFWKDQAEARRILQRRRRLQDDIDLTESLRTQEADLAVLAEWAASGEDVLSDLASGLDRLEEQVEVAETKRILGGEHDRASAVMTIHPGAGGTESQDWADMLLRMYLKWAERRGFKREILDYQPGDEAGLKSATVTVTGEYAYGLLLAEAGVHRLVRISPFDQDARRHTSFASVYVWPEIEDDTEIEVDEKDIRVDTFCSSGPGGQGVNTTYSAVRITHLPTSIVVSCQNERSQIRNREAAMKVLKSRLYDIKIREQQAEIERLGGEKKDIAFGSQIRSYVLQPYQMVKDHRTKVQMGDVERVLGGDIDVFIKSYLRAKANGTLGQATGADD